MSDLVKRLRMAVDPDDPNLWTVDKDRKEAADHIEALEAEIKEWRMIVENLESQIKADRANQQLKNGQK